MTSPLERALHMTAVGLVSFAVTGTKHAPPIQAENVLQSGIERIQDERRRLVEVNFRNWPHVVPDHGCYEKYPDAQSGDYHIKVFCPNFIDGTYLEGAFRDFDLETKLSKLSGNNLWYGVVAIENEGGYGQAHHFFMLSGDGVFRYQKIAFNAMRIQREIVRPISNALAHREDIARMGIVREAKKVQVFYNDVPLFETDIFARSHDAVSLSLAISTDPTWQPEPEESHIIFHGVRFFIPDRRWNPHPQTGLANNNFLLPAISY